MAEVKAKPNIGLAKDPDLGLRERFFGILAPGAFERIRSLEGELIKIKDEGLLEQTELRLQRANQQLNSLMKDVGVQQTQWVNLSSGDYNPEEISMTEYKKMLNYDANVIAGFDLIKMGILMKPWKVVHPDVKIREAITGALKQMYQPTFREACKEMMKAIPLGYSVTEIVFDEYRDEYLMPRRTNGLKTFDPESITFFSDAASNLLKIQQISASKGYIDLPLDRTLVWSHEREYGNWYGVAMLRGLYTNWFIKQAMLKFANIAYERFGSPILLGIAKNEKELNSILEAMTHLFARSQAAIVRHEKDDPTAIDVIESKKAEMPFDRYIEYNDHMILRRMLIGQRIFEGGGGVYGPKVPMDLVLMRFEDFRLELLDVLNRFMQIIADLNWSDLNEYPTIEFEPLTTADRDFLKTTIWEAIEKGVVPANASWIRNQLGLPEVDQDGIGTGTPEKKTPPGENPKGVP